MGSPCLPIGQFVKKLNLVSYVALYALSIKTTCTFFHSAHKTVTVLHCVPKNIPDIFDCNAKKDYRILIIFLYEYSWDNLSSSDNLISHLTQHLFLYYLGKIEQTKYHFFIQCDMIA